MIYKTEFKAMGCQMLAALDSPDPQAVRFLESVPDWFRIWEATLSRFRPQSELSQINASTDRWFRVSETLWSVLQTAIRAEEHSGGLVTPTLLQNLIAAGYNRSFDSSFVAESTSEVIDYHRFGIHDIQIDPEDFSIRLPYGLYLDFGGVAKGWAANQALERLQSYGSALVDAGGDIAISGAQRDGQLWPVAIDDPRRPGSSLGLLSLGNSGVATSGQDYRRWQQGVVWKHHIIDPRTGEPAVTDVLSATIIAPTVMEAETAAKTVLIMGSQAGLGWLEARPALAGLLVLTDDRVVQSSCFNKYLWSA
jgi:thiamine biosynthesis lipoprotein